MMDDCGQMVVDTDQHNEDSGYHDSISDNFEDANTHKTGAHCRQLVYTEHITVDEYERQTKYFTESSVHELVNSPQYLMHINTCSLCGRCWYTNECSSDCAECGSFALTRPCLVCEGLCQNLWHRDVDMSHTFHSAHWDGVCGLPEDQQRALMLQKFVEPTEDNITEAMGTLMSGT